VVSPDQQRAAADYLGERYGVSQRRACRIMGRSRSTLRYRRRRRSDEPALTREIKRLARRHPRYGYRRVHARLVRRGWSVNLKRVRRLWNELGLRRPLRLRKPRKLGPKPGVSANSCVQQPTRFKDDVWTCDFIHDRTADGRPLKWLTLVVSNSAPLKTGRELRMQESHRKDPASHPDPESCVGGRKDAGEALTGAHAGQPSSCVITVFGVPTLSREAEGNTASGAMGKPSADPAQSQETVHAWKLLAREPGGPAGIRPWCGGSVGEGH